MSGTLFLALLLAAPPAVADSVTSYQKLPDGVTVALAHGSLLLQALAPRVIRVRYSADDQFPDQRVPVIISHDDPPTFAVTANNQAITLTTAGLTARVDRATGALRFVDHAGQTILAETPGARTLTPITLDGQSSTTPSLEGRAGVGSSPVPSCKSEDRFDLARGEAVYGLGQHQSGYLDYRGGDVTLEQTNREIAIPFLVSSRGYGLLWNNAAHTDVNLGGRQEVIPSTALADDTGQPGGLTGRYFQGENFDTSAGTQVDPRIDFNWTATPPLGLPHDHYSVRWTGFVTAGVAGDYTFQTASDDGVRLWIDGKQVIDDWTTHALTTDMATVHFDANSRHTIKLEYFQNAYDAVVRLSWNKPAAGGSVDWSSEAADDIDYTVFYGPSLDKVIAEYRHATGDAPLPPKWALGYWQSKERYNTQQEWLDIAAEYRQRQEPIDNIVQDWFYWNPFPWGSHKFDPTRYADPAAAIDTLHRQYHMHFMISVWGKFNAGSPSNPNANYDALDNAGFLYPAAVSGDRYYDAFNPDARALYWQLMRDQIFDKGVDAWWLDASEPEVDMSQFRKTPTGAGLGAQVLNGWPLMHTTAVSTGQLRDAPGKRVFILTRSAYAGQQRTGAASWSGDITASWDVYKNQIPAGLNFCLSGIPYWTTDIGAFFVPYPGGCDNPEYRELYTRWFEYGSFCPIFRSHGTNTPREMWRFGPDVEKILLKYDTLRYRLMPYIYSQAWQVTSHGGTIMRALVMDFPDDATARECKDEFLFGPAILVCPVVEKGVTSRRVYLPAGTSWTDFWTGAHYRGGQTVDAAASLDTIPLFVRDGAVIPMGPSVQYVDEKPADPIELRVYPGADGSFTLYEDQGDTNDYRQGQYATIPISWNDKTKKLTIGDRVGSFPGMLKARTFRIIRVRPGLGGVEPVEAGAESVKYNGG